MTTAQPTQTLHPGAFVALDGEPAGYRLRLAPDGPHLDFAEISPPLDDLPLVPAETVAALAPLAADPAVSRFSHTLGVLSRIAAPGLSHHALLLAPATFDTLAALAETDSPAAQDARLLALVHAQLTLAFARIRKHLLDGEDHEAFVHRLLNAQIALDGLDLMATKVAVVQIGELVEVAGSGRYVVHTDDAGEIDFVPALEPDHDDASQPGPADAL